MNWKKISRDDYTSTCNQFGNCFEIVRLSAEDNAYCNRDEWTLVEIINDVSICDVDVFSTLRAAKAAAISIR